jgi:hypothetical protein
VQKTFRPLVIFRNPSLGEASKIPKMSEITSESRICDVCLAPDSFGLIKRETYDRKYRFKLPVGDYGVCFFGMDLAGLLASAEQGCYFCDLLHQLLQHPCSGGRKAAICSVRICTDPALSVRFRWYKHDHSSSIIQIYRPFGLSC